MSELRVISWNLLHSKGADVEQVKTLVTQYRPDLLLMQEATARIDHLPDRLGGFYARHVLPGRLHGLAAWCARNFAAPVTTLSLQNGLIVRRVCQLLELNGIGFANVHLSHGQILNRRQLRRIAERLPAKAAILGDCNLVGPPLLRGFKDVGPRHATHESGTILPLRLDRCFVRGVGCKAAEILHRGASDHRPILVVLQPSPD